MDIQILKRGPDRVRIEARTPQAIEWLVRFSVADSMQFGAVAVEISAEALHEYEKAAREAGLEVS